jgi:hypothetical protein
MKRAAESLEHVRAQHAQHVAVVQSLSTRLARETAIVARLEALTAKLEAAVSFPWPDLPPDMHRLIISMMDPVSAHLLACTCRDAGVLPNPLFQVYSVSFRSLDSARQLIRHGRLSWVR